MMRLHENIRALPQLTIAKISGFARGGGSELALACDLRFASTRGTGLAQPEAPGGIIPGAGGTAYLAQLVGRARAIEIIVGAQLVDASTAERYGWINRALPPGELDAYVDALASRAARLAPDVVRSVVQAVDAALPPLGRGLSVADQLLVGLLKRPESARLTRAALSAGAQTRAGERALEAIMHQE